MLPIFSRLPSSASLRRLLRVVRLLGERQLAESLSSRLVSLQETEAPASKVLHREGVQVAGLPQGNGVQGGPFSGFQLQTRG